MNNRTKDVVWTLVRADSVFSSFLWSGLVQPPAEKQQQRRETTSYSNEASKQQGENGTSRVPGNKRHLKKGFSLYSRCRRLSSEPVNSSANSTGSRLPNYIEGLLQCRGPESPSRCLPDSSVTAHITPPEW